ncbi:MAG: hypothetical protein JNK63_09385 [Chthonomonas sp.]|nr:hypothetical protein [Chthonomonas sp.]
MISLTLTFALITAPPTPGALVSKMFARYAGADKLSGSIQFKQSGAERTLSISTLIQAERPHKLYVKQSRPDTKQTAIIAADGTMFTYEMPDSIAKRSGDRLYELQNQRGVVYTVGDIYTIGLPGLLDRSPVLDTLIAKTAHLSYVRGQIASLAWKDGDAPEAGKNGVVVGDWRAYQNAPVSGKFAVTISPEGDLLNWNLKEYVAVPGQKPILVTSDWSVSIKVGDSGNATLFRVVRK